MSGFEQCYLFSISTHVWSENYGDCTVHKHANQKGLSGMNNKGCGNIWSHISHKACLTEHTVTYKGEAANLYNISTIVVSCW